MSQESEEEYKQKHAGERYILRQGERHIEKGDHEVGITRSW